jgi:hypothetical protein
MPKRPRSGESSDLVGRASFVSDRRASIDFAPRTTYSPPPIDTAPASAYPRGTSPSNVGRPLRPLPSPSSLIHPPSAAPSVVAAAIPSTGSPAPSYQPSGSVHSVHTASASSATSAHMADLQHQVTLKSLALQTLQSEYASLLQKLQRERVKSQTIEKKTNVADQEVNDLTGRNEELADAVKNLEVRLEESEKKRESERADIAREKEQWGRMLDMSNRLQARQAEERQKLAEERDLLKARVTAYEEQGITHAHNFESDVHGQLSRDSDVAVDEDVRQSKPGVIGVVAGLKREVGVLKARIEILRFSLQQVKRHNEETGDKTRDFLDHSNNLRNAIDRVLNDGGWDVPSKNLSKGQATTATSQDGSPNSGKSTSPQREATTLSSTQEHAPRPQEAPRSHNALQQPPMQQRPASPLTIAASKGRAVSPGPEELGFHVQPSTSSPEELIRALGPVPAPVSGLGNVTAPSPANYQAQDERPRGVAPPYIDAWKLPPPPTLRHNRFRKDGLSPHGSDDSGVALRRPYSEGEDALRPRPQVPPYHHITPYNNQGLLPAHAATSPLSYRSSPGPARDGNSPSNSSGSNKARSPDSVASDPEPTLKLEKSSPHPVPGFEEIGSMPRFPEMSIQHHGLGSFRHYSYAPKMDAAAAMPPPPRPFT